MATVPVVKPVPLAGSPAPAATAVKKVNEIGLERTDYKGADSTLCAGCGHDSISSQIITACYEVGLSPEHVIKLSGIGCSSKSPAYFMSRSFGINTLHGRMAAVATGALTANHKLIGIGVSGDGDTGSIGLGNFKHMLRRNVHMVYIIENNGVYGLTKGQFSATADVGQELKHAGRNELPPIDLCIEALAADCGFVARGFAGDPKSYAWGKANDERINDFTFVAPQEEITAEFQPGESKEVEMHDGSHILIKRLDQGHDPTNRNAAMTLLQEARQKQLFITGLIYVDGSRESLAEHEDLGDVPLARLPNATLRPSKESLQKIMAAMA
jgi:2-oxoglutarate ferredoxin oxidoreductase subunit beta